ncbi:MAG: hypothetical protein L0Z62_19880 [Gemmataceae bacterium]|nr:hypothetical protein [Gemmataceae bacterium]
MPAAVLSVWDAWVPEGADARHAAVTVTLSEPHSNAVSVNYRTVAGTAQAGSDFDAVSGKLTFAKNEMSKTILVPIRDDRLVEPDESFFVQLEGAKAGARLANAQAQVTLADNEPRISISNTSVREGTSGLTPMTFTVRLSQEYDLPVTVHWATADGSATAGVDYVAKADTLVFAKGETSKTIEVLVLGDHIPEPDRSFSVNLTSTPDSYAVISDSGWGSSGVGTGSILDSSPRISIADVYHYGEATFTFTVSLSVASDEIVTVDFATLDGTATAGVDYVANFGTLTFDRNETTRTIMVDLLNPDYFAYLYFYVQLSNPSGNAAISNELAGGYSYYYDGGYYDYGYYDYGYYDYGYYDYGYYW